MKVYYKTKILINGIFPLINFKIDGFTEKTGIYHEKTINSNSDDYLFYSSSFLIKGTYACEEKEGGFYEYFENEEYFERDLPDNITLEDIQKIISNEQDEKVATLEKKIRLITGLGITLPVFKTDIYDEDKKFIANPGYIHWRFSFTDARDYDDNMKKQLEQRLQLHIADSTILDLENKNQRYKTALYFYNKSFNSYDIGIRFTLLFSALESLFNITGEEVTREVAELSSRIMFLSSNERGKLKYKIKNYYDERSKFIHGNGNYIISSEIENNLRDYVREILLIYWNISTIYKIYNAEEIKKLVLSINRDKLDIQSQLFIKYLRTPIEKYKELYNRIRTNFMNKDYKILSNSNLNIKNN